MKVRDPQGQVWRVSRRWVPWRRRLKGSLDGGPTVDAGGFGDDPISMVLGAVVLVLLVPFLLLALVAGLELLLLLLVMPVALLGRVLFGQEWTIEVRRGWRPWWEQPAGGWTDSGLRIADVAAAIERGHLPPQTLA